MIPDKDFKKLVKIRNACLENAASLISSARSLCGIRKNHIRYHLATLALEEIGKSEMARMKLIADADTSGSAFNPRIDDHTKKLFWAFWGPIFHSGKITKKEIESYQNLAKIIHEKRLFGLYIDTNNPLLPQNKIGKEETDNLIIVAQSRLKAEKTYSLMQPKPNSIEAAELNWFSNAMEEEEKRRLIMGGPSIKKLIEFKDGKAWIKWLYQQFKSAEEDSKLAVNEELARQKPTGKETKEKKWRIKIRVESESHAIRNKNLNEWNKNVDWIQLSSDDNRILLITFFLTKSFHVMKLWLAGWSFARSFVTALNIATKGFFWWHIPKDREKYYEEIWDLDRKMGIGIRNGPILSIGWKKLHLVLEERHLNLTSMIFAYITETIKKPEEKIFNHYVEGLAFLSKTDIHTRFELNAFYSFYNAFKEAILASGDWNSTEDIKNAITRIFKMDSYNNLYQSLDIGAEMDASATRIPKSKVTLTEVFGMKLWCDMYIPVLARHALDKHKAEKDKLPKE